MIYEIVEELTFSDLATPGAVLNKVLVQYISKSGLIQSAIFSISEWTPANKQKLIEKVDTILNK